MARAGNIVLDTGDYFPEMEFQMVGGPGVTIPRAFIGHWSVFLIYRGQW
jgi:hypothetical protein